MMHPATPSMTLDTLWDAGVVLFLAALTLWLPDIFPHWMALGALPLLACRAAIVRTELRLRT